MFAVILTSLTKGQRVLELLKLLNAIIKYVPVPLVKSNVKALHKLTNTKAIAADKAAYRQTITLYGNLINITGAEEPSAATCMKSVLSSLSSPTPKTRKHVAATLREVLSSPSPPLSVVQAVEDFLLEALPSSPSQVRENEVGSDELRKCLLLLSWWIDKRR